MDEITRVKIEKLLEKAYNLSTGEDVKLYNAILLARYIVAGIEVPIEVTKILFHVEHSEGNYENNQRHKK